MIELWTIAALGLASARGTQLIVGDSILDPVRDKLELWHAKKHDSRVRTFLRYLWTCVLCVGFHTSWIAVLAYLLATGSWGDASWLVHGVEVFAVAAVQVTINLHWDK